MELKSGDYNKIICGDSGSILMEYPDECIDCIITSPPYDNLRSYTKDVHEKYEFDFSSIAQELVRVLKPGGVIVWVVGDETKKGSETGNSFRQALFFHEDLGLDIHDTMIYKKNSSSFPARKSADRYSQIFEYMFVFSKGKPKTAHLLCDKPNAWKGWLGFGKMTQRNRDGQLVEIKRDPIGEYSPRNNIWKYATGKSYSASDDLASLHPAIFPEGLVGDHLLTWTEENDVILDVFNGSGTTTKMAFLLNRRYIGIDISEEYCGIARKRIELCEKKVYETSIDFGEEIDLENREKNWKKDK